MEKKKFREFVNRIVSIYGVYSYLDNDDEDDLWVTCPECDDPILYEDWKDSEELLNGYCPICENRIID